LRFLGPAAVLTLVACGGGDDAAAQASAAAPAPQAAARADGLAEATFAGGCFWCMEPPLDELDGVIATTSGFTGGHVEDPTYEAVSAGDTGHFHAVQVTYDPGLVSYAELLGVFWRNVDPLDEGGQFCDRGPQYRSAIFVHNEEQERLARRSKQALERSGALPARVRTPILPVQPFFAATEDHQDYYRDHPLRYRFYRFTCGRDDRLEELWGSVNLDDVLSSNHP
jgi:peptide-methionine (S)-S-oxide reductase